MKITLASNYQTVEWEVPDVASINNEELKRVIALVNYLGIEVQPKPEGSAPAKPAKPASDKQKKYLAYLYGDELDMSNISYEEADKLIKDATK